MREVLRGEKSQDLALANGLQLAGEAAVPTESVARSSP